MPTREGSPARRRSFSGSFSPGSPDAHPATSPERPGYHPATAPKSATASGFRTFGTGPLSNSPVWLLNPHLVDERADEDVKLIVAHALCNQVDVLLLNERNHGWLAEELSRGALLQPPRWGRWGAALWLAVLLPALILLPPHWGELAGDFTDRVLAVDNLLLLWVVFPLIKAAHEFGHAMATKRGGGEVHDVGIVMLVLLPVPYVEASASTVFRSKFERALVGAAGMAR